jgi:hypothetical protein
LSGVDAVEVVNMIRLGNSIRVNAIISGDTAKVLPIRYIVIEATVRSWCPRGIDRRGIGFGNK